jgi:hypothetical protein
MAQIYLKKLRIIYDDDTETYRDMNTKQPIDMKEFQRRVMELKESEKK